MVQETHLKPRLSNACKISNFVQLRTDRQGAPKGGTALYYNRSLYCCPIDTPPLVNIEATACRLSMTGHGILILVSVYLPPKKKLLRSDLEALFALLDAVILFGDFNSKSTNWNCNYTNSNGRKMEALAEDIHFNIIPPLSPTHYRNNDNYRLKNLLPWVPTPAPPPPRLLQILGGKPTTPATEGQHPGAAGGDRSARSLRVASRVRVRGSFIVWRRYPNGDGRSPRGFELGDRRVRRSAPSVPQRGGKTPRLSEVPRSDGLELAPSQATYSYERTGRTLEEAIQPFTIVARSIAVTIAIPPLVNMEATGCRLAMTGHRTIVIVSVYLPSPKPLLRSDLRALLALGDAVILFGDFNCKNPRWGCAVTDENGEKLDRLQDRLEFEIIAPATATYFTYNDSNRPSTLDIALTKGVALNLNNIETLDRLSSDHRPVLLKMGPPDGGKPISTTKITNWKRVTTEQIDHAIGALTSHVRTVVKRCEREVPASSDHRKFPPDILELIRAKNKALRRASAYPTPEYRSRARALQREVKARVQEFRNESWSDLMEEITPSHKAFWKITKALKTKGYTPIPPLKRPDGSIALDDVEVLQKTSLEPKDDLTPVSLSEVQLLVRLLKTRKALGLDGISNKAIKCFPQQLLSLLVAIFNACLQNCYFPSVWKEAEVIGIHKPGKPRDLPASYRPISLLSGLAKLFERVLKTRLSDHLLGKGLIIDEQFGFRPAHSCPQQVLRVVEYISEGFKNKQKTVAVFFDVAKAFDRVWHAGLVHKLYSLQMPDRLVIIIQNYLANRHFTYRHEHTHSTRRLIRAGVPQGSALSPLLYSAYTNDIPRPTSGVQLVLFADDTALYYKSRNRTTLLTIRRLQRAIDELVNGSVSGG
ncbi:RNA-directed DNA polymerase from mobile element jockey [Eumeta japonica]|uniref:RNA-directed DNA polymerase from mobile element jockey n=1 Tax=Eumeta variegata TaxID=151549 RepID=A0A4C1XZ91_EUMVA|nr:RNA-directed DNA polymerase from mobile element jockey [Eumeta japonica]